MRWGIRKQRATQCVQEDERERGGKGRGRAFSFSPLSWLGKLNKGKEKPGPAASTPKNGVAPSCLPKRASPSPAVVAPRRSPAADVVPRRLSVVDAVAARLHNQHRRRHCSLGGDRELLPLGHMIPFSLAGSPALSPRTVAAPPSETDKRRRRRRRKNHSRRLSNGGGGGIGSGRRSSFSGRMRAVRVRSPRRELEHLAVVRRTRDPQRAFRESMVEMIASSGGGARPEELERLLACYLSLNADKHHDCIVKVFRQVWFEYVNLLPRPDAGRRRPPRRR